MANTIYSWITASRPWTFTAAIMPITLGSILPYFMHTSLDFNFFKLILYMLSLLGGICLQAAANFFNTYGDYVSGVDSLTSAFSCPQLVTKAMKPESIKFAGIFMVVVAFVIGIILSVLCGWIIFVFGLIGLAGAFFYTMGWFPYKYVGLGVPLVFFLMGPFMVVPTYYIQSELLEFYPVFVSMPVAFLASAIMHANDLRDIDYDRSAGIHTIALSLGLESSILLYFFLCLSAFLSALLLVLFNVLPVTVMISWILFPQLWIKFRRIYSSPTNKEIKGLVVWTAFFHLWFSVFFMIGIVVHLIV